ncbi:MAG: hypothetical protein AVDCRST_MAG28-3129 [uncultured Rubrobacteraceae bacterium]|uniref:Uncharacterized protein n=1 Tax=uncultured Rubrobacteraceae bacterium TaxID=349277 RepID=A0A6J4R5H8_9ACTN|nr:MAG: hypothetical protein AVDCRST_MAG28-3129 [uncultured Rubrobacteraceae bacterium]
MRRGESLDGPAVQRSQRPESLPLIAFATPLSRASSVVCSPTGPFFRAL